MSYWSKIAALEFVVDGYELERLSDGAPGSDRVTVHMRLLGADAVGLGEDIWPFAEEQDALLAAGPALPLAGQWTMADFCAHLATLEQWSEPPSWAAGRDYRNWAYESAALDLALRQNVTSLPDLLAIEPRPVRFVNSLGLGPRPGAVARPAVSPRRPQRRRAGTVQRPRPRRRAAAQPARPAARRRRLSLGGLSLQSRPAFRPPAAVRGARPERRAPRPA